MLVNAVDAAVLIDQFGCSLFANPGDTGKIVGRIAAKRGVVHIVSWLYTGTFEDAGFVIERVVRNTTLVVEHLDMRIMNELVAVAIASDDDDVVTARFGRCCQGCDDVVGFETNEVEHGNAQRFDNFANNAHLLTKKIGSGIAISLIGGKRFVAEGWFGSVEHHCQVIGLLISEKIDKHRRKSEDRISDLTRRRCHVGRQRKECSVRQRVSVDEHQRGHGVSGVRVPSRIDSATARIVVRSRIAVFCTKVNESASVKPWVSMRTPLALSTTLRVSS